MTKPADRRQHATTRRTVGMRLPDYLQVASDLRARVARGPVRPESVGTVT
jgi:hypothetical protein